MPAIIKAYFRALYLGLNENRSLYTLALCSR